MTDDLQQREPMEAELFQSLARAMRRLGGDGDNTAAAIQRQMDGADFVVAARAIDVPLGDLISVFRDEMAKLGFVVTPMGRIQ
jgi:hypothetical protein